MKIVEQNATKLAFSIGAPYFNATQCDFDRTGPWNDQADDDVLADENSRHSAERNCRRQTRCRNHQHSGFGQLFKSYPGILLKSGRRIAMASFRESSSKKAVEAMRVFLELGT